MDPDSGILIFIQENIRSDLLTPFMTFITHTCDYGLIWIIISIFLLLIPKSRRIGIIAGSSIALEALITNLIIKNYVARTRPYEVIDGLINLIEKQKDYSFPSGHSGASFAVAGVLIMVALLGLPAAEAKGRLSRSKTSSGYKIFAALMLLYATIIAFSRLYVGVHYPTDVLGGVLLGIGTSILAYFVYQQIIKTVSKRKAEKEEATAKA